MKLKKIILSLLILITFLIPVSFASWYISGLNTNIPATEESVSPVAYIVKDGERQEFNTLERALYTANTGDVVYIIPNIGTEAGKTNKPCVLSNDSTIKSGVTLFLPYDNNNNRLERVANDPKHSPLTPQTYLKNHLIINEGVTLTNYGEIVIAGVLNGGNGGNYMNGQTCGKYSQITLCSGASLINESGSSIYCYGTFNEDITSSKSKPLIQMKKGSCLLAPIVVNEHRGGVIYTFLYRDMKAPPFNRWYFANIFATIEFQYGSEFIANADLYANNQHNTADVKILGTDNSYLIHMQQNTIVDFKCENHEFSGSLKSFKEYKNYINIYGSFEFNSMSMSVAGMEVSTSGVLFPLSYHHSINLYPFKNGTEAHNNLNQNIKMLPGSELTIKKGVSASINQLAVYENFDTDVGLGGAKYKTSEEIGAAQLLIEGILTVNTFGGYAQTKTERGEHGALFVINQTNKISVPEIKSVPDKWQLILLWAKPSFQYIDLTAQGDIENGGDKSILEVSKPYESIAKRWTVSSRARAYKIEFNVNSPSGGFPSYLWQEGETKKQITFYTFNNSEFTLKSIGVSPAFTEYHTMIDRAKDPGGNELISKTGLAITPQDPYNIKEIKSVYAIWKETEFRIEYVLKFDNAYEGADKDKLILDMNTYTVSKNSEITLQNVEVENKDYTVYKWYIYNQGEAYADKRESSVNLQKEFKNSAPILKLYGHVSKPSEIATVSFDNNNTSYYASQPILPTIDVKKGTGVPNNYIALNIASLSAYNENPRKNQYLDNFVFNDVTFDEEVIVNENIIVTTSWKNKYHVHMPKHRTIVPYTAAITVNYQNQIIDTKDNQDFYVLPSNNVISVASWNGGKRDNYKFKFNLPENVVTNFDRQVTEKDKPITGTITINGNVTIELVKV